MALGTLRLCLLILLLVLFFSSLINSQEDPGDGYEWAYEDTEEVGTDCIAKWANFHSTSHFFSSLSAWTHPEPHIFHKLITQEIEEVSVNVDGGSDNDVVGIRNDVTSQNARNTPSGIGYKMHKTPGACLFLSTEHHHL